MTEKGYKNIDRFRCHRGQLFTVSGNRGFLPQSPSDFVVLQVVSVLNKVMDIDALKEVVVDGANCVCINGVPVGDWREMTDIGVTDDGMLSFRYGNDCKRVVNFGYYGYERRNRVKEVIELGREMPSRIIWSEDTERINV